MKYIILFLLMGLSNISKSQVDIRLTSVSSNQLSVDLLPSEMVTSTLSSIVFTIKSDESILILDSDGLTGLEEVYDNNGYYTTFLYFGMVTEDIGPRTYNIQKMSGGYNIQILNDDFTNNNNRDFYVSIGGEDVTGDILQMTTSINEDKIINDNKRHMFYDVSDDRWVILFNGKWTDLYGREVYLGSNKLLSGFIR